MSGKVKNQHYVPQMYLERFTSNGRMSVWALDDDEIRTRQHPRNYAAKRYFYDEERSELKKHLQEIIELHPETEAVIDQSDEQFVEKYSGCAISRIFLKKHAKRAKSRRGFELQEKEKSLENA